MSPEPESREGFLNWDLRNAGHTENTAGERSRIYARSQERRKWSVPATERPVSLGLRELGEVAGQSVRGGSGRPHCEL